LKENLPELRRQIDVVFQAEDDVSNEEDMNVDLKHRKRMREDKFDFDVRKIDAMPAILKDFSVPYFTRSHSKNLNYKIYDIINEDEL
jgi:hypothetical protein